MTITNDAYGNYFIGNKDTTDLLNWDELLSCMRQALGSSDRAALFKSGHMGFNNYARIDWRPNIPQETLTGAIAVSDTYPQQSLDLNTSRFSVIYHTDNTVHTSLINNGSIISHGTGARKIDNSSNTTLLWAVANRQSISYFLFKSNTNYYFHSVGVLNNSDQVFPGDAYAFAIQSTPEWFDQYEVSAKTSFADASVSVFGTVANYSHTNNNNIATQSETELYLRWGSSGNLLMPVGCIPNVFKWKVDGTETPLAIGSTVKLNMINQTPDFPSTGFIYCRVVGRLGNTSISDITGDYILMRVAN